MIEMVEAACAMPTTMQGRILEDVARNIDAETIRQPVGVCAAIVPFNFPAMVPFWFLPFAIACGNTFVLKPSEQVPMTQQIAFEELDALGLPAGRRQPRQRRPRGRRGDPRAPRGSTRSRSSARRRSRELVYERAAQAGKRVQALGGAKNHMVVMPDAVIDKTVDGHHRLGVRRRRAAVHGRLGRGHRRRRPRAADRAAGRGDRGAARRRRRSTRGRRRPGDLVRGARPDRRLGRARRRRRRRARGRRPRRRRGRRPRRRVPRPDDPRRGHARDGDRRTRRCSARCCASSSAAHARRGDRDRQREPLRQRHLDLHRVRAPRSAATATRSRRA